MENVNLFEYNPTPMDLHIRVKKRDNSGVAPELPLTARRRRAKEGTLYLGVPYGSADLSGMVRNATVDLQFHPGKITPW